MDLLVPSIPTPLTRITDEITEQAGIRLFIKRDDLIHPAVSGNKWRKLKYSLIKARADNEDTLLTFGGAFSNHLYATAAAGAALGFKTIGVVRGEDMGEKRSSTLRFCAEQGMALHFVSRQEYKQRSEEDYVTEMKGRFGDVFLIPEGGTSDLALEGVKEMVDEVKEGLGASPDYYAVAAGTGGTAAGLLAGGGRVLAFSALKGGAFLEDDILRLAGQNLASSLTLFTDYHFKGYGRYTEELLHFITSFKKNHQIQLEQVYTGKMLFGLYDLISKGYFQPDSRIVAIHTGGLQGLLPELKEDK